MKQTHLAWWTAGVLACGCDAASPSSNGSLADADSSPALCDGSDEIRFGFSESGGQLSQDDGFLSPTAYAFLVVRGDCRYLVSTRPSGEIRAGELDASRADKLAQDTGWRRIAEWSRFKDTESCSDAGDVSLHALGKRASCTCGCRAKASSGLEAAITAASDALQELWDQAQPVSGPVTAVAYTPPGGIAQSPDALTPQDWPLSSSIERILVSDPIAINASAGERFEQNDAAALRALRVTASKRAQFVQSLPVRGSDGVTHVLLLRDELPEDFSGLPGFLH